MTYHERYSEEHFVINNRPLLIGWTVLDIKCKYDTYAFLMLHTTCVLMIIKYSVLVIRLGQRKSMIINNIRKPNYFSDLKYY